MNDYDAAAIAGDVVRKMHNYTMTPESGAEWCRPFMRDPALRSVIITRIDASVRTNQETIRQAQNRNADLVKLRDLVNAMGRATNPHG